MLPLSQLAGWLYVFDFRPRKRREITLREETMKNQPCSPRMFVAFIAKSGVGGWVLLAPGAAYSMLVQNLLLEDCTVSVSVRYANKQEKPARDGNACWKGDTQFAVQLIGSCKRGVKSLSSFIEALGS